MRFCSPTTLLSVAMQSGHADVVEVLLREGATSDEPTPNGRIPLALAAEVSAS